jgi:hypothetical protein
MPDFTESITIEATPDRLYALVSDLPRIGDWSPECTRVTRGGRRDARWSNRRAWLRAGRLGEESGWHALEGCRQRWSVWC